MIELSVKTPDREVFVDITGQVRDALVRLADGDSLTGVVHVFVPHTTAGITINEGADPSVQDDILNTLRNLIPRHGGYRHGEGNADAHVKASLMGSHATLPVEDGELRLGTWQSVYLTEFDGPRTRRVWVQFTPSA